jgi:hypothetical protein
MLFGDAKERVDEIIRSLAETLPSSEVEQRSVAGQERQSTARVGARR